MDAYLHDTRQVELGKTMTRTFGSGDESGAFYTRRITITTRNGKETLTLFSDKIENLAVMPEEEE